MLLKSKEDYLHFAYAINNRLHCDHDRSIQDAKDTIYGYLKNEGALMTVDDTYDFVVKKLAYYMYDKYVMHLTGMGEYAEELLGFLFDKYFGSIWGISKNMKLPEMYLLDKNHILIADNLPFNLFDGHKYETLFEEYLQVPVGFEGYGEPDNSGYEKIKHDVVNMLLHKKSFM